MLFGYFFLNQTSGYHAVFCSSTVFWPHCGFLATSGSVVTAGAGVRHRLTWSQAVHLRTRVKLQPQLWGWHGVMGMITKTGFSSSCCPVNRRGDVCLFAVFAVNSCVRISPGTLATVFSIWLFKSKKTESVWINLTDKIFLLPVWPSPVNLWHQLTCDTS